MRARVYAQAEHLAVFELGDECIALEICVHASKKDLCSATLWANTAAGRRSCVEAQCAAPTGARTWLQMPRLKTSL